MNLEQDEDGVVRRARVRFPTRSGETLESFAAAAARSLSGERPPDPPARGRWLRLAAEGTYHIDFTASPTAGATVSWREVSGLLDRRPEVFAGKLVLLGAKLAGSGDEALRVPVGDGTTAGVLIQALAVNTLLSGFPVREPPGLLLAGALAVAVGVVAFAALSRASLVPAAIGAALLAATHLASAVLVFRTGRWLVPMAAPALLLVAGAALAVGLRAALPAHPLRAGKGAIG